MLEDQESFRMRSGEWGVRSAEWGMRSAEWGMGQSAECGVGNGKVKRRK